jgi:hypothetical protein
MSRRRPRKVFKNRKAKLTNAANGDQRGAEKPAPNPVIAPEDANPRPPQETKGAKKRHTWLEYFAVAFAACAFVAAGYQGWIARDTEIRQLRAYVFVGSASIVFEDARIRGVVEIKNFGQTPAYNLGSLIYMGIAEIGVSEPPFDSALTVAETNRAPLAPQERKTQPQSISPPIEGIKSVADGSRKLFMWGKVEYDDAFGCRRILNYRMVAIRVGDTWGLQPTANGNNEEKQRASLSHLMCTIIHD